MKLAPALRSPYRARSIVHASPTVRIDEAGLEAGAVLTQLALLALCTARAGADLVDRVRTIEGGVALGLAVILMSSLVARLIRRVVRGPTGGRRLPPNPSRWTLESHDARAG
jgi:hypothetical protein